VREVAPQAADASRTVRVRATLPVADNPPALGSSASITFDTPAPLLALPASAVVKRDDGSAAVWVIDAEHAARLKPITLGPLQGDQASIAAGLAPGEWVITAGVHDLRDGQPVPLP
jgi:multidrug efflux pump subunit AcrA (membrane-fusion protein)